MKKVACSLLLCVCVVSVSAASKHEKAFWEKVFKGVETRIVLHVVDDEGVSVPDVKGHFIFSRVEKYDEKDCVTDHDGNCVVDNLTCGNSIEVNLSKEGYYDSSLKLCYNRVGNVYEVKDGKWQPYPMERTVTLRKIRNPVALVHVGKIFVFPATNTWVGFDMKACDFVAPNGTGDISDFACMVEWDGLPPTKSKYCRMSLRMSGELSGGYYQSCVADSEYPYAYFAKMPECFLRDIDIVSRNGDPCATEVPFRKNSEFITRTRCKVDEQGNLISSNYGSIRVLGVSPSWDGNPTLKLRLVFNPVPNDTNLEDDEAYLRHMKDRKRRHRRDGAMK